MRTNDQHVWITITDRDDTVVDRFVLDGLNLAKSGDQQYLGERVGDGLGGRLLTEVAALPVPFDDDDLR